MSGSVLDETLSLATLLDVEGFREVCRSFGALYGIGIKVFDLEGAKVVDVRASTGDHCGYLFTVHPTQVQCTALVNRLRTTELTAASPIQTFTCFSGLSYRVVPLCFDGGLLGRLIFGPFAPTALTQPPEMLRHIAPELNLTTLAQYLASIPRADDATVTKVLGHLVSLFDVIMHSSYRAHVTAKLHIASISSAFADLEVANRTLKQANQKLQDLDRLKSNFIATVSHELRTPLTSVIGYSEMLLEGMAGSLNQEQTDYIRTILEKGESLLGLIGQVLDMSRIESGNVAMQFEPTDIRSVLDLCVTDVMPQAKKRELTVAVETLPDLTPIAIDRDKIRRVVTNLLGNAVKFSKPMGRIEVIADRVEAPPTGATQFDRFEPERNRYLRLRVVDHGIGIPADKLSSIWEAFYQVDNSSTREFGGTGLGLAIVRSFVEAHHGSVAVQSELGKGSVFGVLLPYVTDEVKGEAGELIRRA